MANNNDIIRHSDIAEYGVMKPLQDELIATIKILNSLDTEIVKIATDLKKSLGSNSFGSSEAIAKFGKQVEYSNEVLKQSNKVKEETIKTEAAFTVAVSSNTKKLDENRIALQNQKKANSESAKLNSDLTGAYDKLAISLAKSKREYKDLFILQQNGSTRAKELKNAIDQMEVSIRSADAAVHQHQRNVGNYGNSFNGLGNSINQITRELPAFTFSAQTGFLALSNNIPILVDNISQLAAKNKALTESGEKSVPVWKQVVSGLFSLQTALSVGITLITVYGKEIGNAITSLFGLTKSTETQEQAQLRLNKAYNDGVASIKELNDYVNGQIDFNTKINVLREKMAGNSQSVINEIEAKGRADGIKNAENHFNEMSTLYARQASQLGQLKLDNLSGKLTDEQLTEQSKIIQEQLEKTGQDVDNAKRLIDSLTYQSGIATQQAKLDAIEQAKDSAKERLKAEEDLQKKRLEAILEELKLEHELRVSDIELMKDDNRKKIALMRENLNYELTVNDIKLKDYVNLYDLQLNLVKKYNNDVADLVRNRTKIDEVEAIEQDQKILQRAQKNQYERYKKMEDLELKQRQTLLQKAFQLTKSFIDKENALKMKAIESDIQASQNRVDQLREIANKGAQNSQENLAFELRRQAELEAKRDKQIRKQIQQEKVLAILRSLGTSNPKNIGDLANSLPSFFEGTEDTGQVNNPLDENGGRVAVLHDNEAVMNKKLNQKRQKAGLDLDKTVEYAIAFKNIVNPTYFDGVPMSKHVNDERQINKLDEVKSEISELKSVIKNRPIRDWEVDKTEGLIRLIQKEGDKTSITQRKSGGLFR